MRGERREKKPLVGPLVTIRSTTHLKRAVKVFSPSFFSKVGLKPSNIFFFKSKLRKTMGRKIFFLSLKSSQKTTFQKHQRAIVNSKLNLTNLTGWPDYFFNFCFGARPTNWHDNFFSHQKSNSGHLQTSSKEIELNFSAKNYLRLKSPSNPLETGRKLTEPEINFLSPQKSKPDGSAAVCDKNKSNFSSKNYISHDISLNFVDCDPKQTTMENNSFSSTDLSDLRPKLTTVKKNPLFQDKRPDRFRKQPDFLWAKTNALTLSQAMALHPVILRKKHGTSDRKLRYSELTLWTNFRRREPFYSYHAEDYILESEFYDSTYDNSIYDTDSEDEEACFTQLTSTDLPDPPPHGCGAPHPKKAYPLLFSKRTATCVPWDTKPLPHPSSPAMGWILQP